MAYYIHFRETAGDGLAAGEIAGAMYSAGTFDATSMAKRDLDGAISGYGVLEVTESDYNTMVSNFNEGAGTWGKHVDDPTGTPSLAAGDPS